MEINRKNTNTFFSLIDRCSLIERERKKEENEFVLRLVSLYNIYIVCVFTFKLFFFVVKQEFLTEASTDLRRRQTTKKKKERKDCTLQCDA